MIMIPLANTFLLIFLIGFVGFLCQYEACGNLYQSLFWPYYLSKKFVNDMKEFRTNVVEKHKKCCSIDDCYKVLDEIKKKQ